MSVPGSPLGASSSAASDGSPETADLELIGSRIDSLVVSGVLQDRMNEIISVPSFPLAQRLAAGLATVAVAVLWAPALPASPLLALAGKLSRKLEL